MLAIENYTASHVSEEFVDYDMATEMLLSQENLPMYLVEIGSNGLAVSSN